MRQVTIEDIANAKFDEPRDDWSVFSTAKGGTHVASFHQSMKAIDRREMSKRVTGLMNGTMQPIEGEVWTHVPNHALALNGVKKIVISTHLPLEVRDWLVREMVKKFNAPKQQ